MTAVTAVAAKNGFALFQTSVRKGCFLHFAKPIIIQVDCLSQKCFLLKFGVPLGRMC